MRHTYSFGENKVVCISHFAGRPVRGIAKCDPSQDVFNEETGCTLARLRCDYKVALKKVNRATKKFHDALEAMNNAEQEAMKMKQYLDDAIDQLNAAGYHLQEFENMLE